MTNFQMCQLLYHWYTWTLIVTMEFGFSTTHRIPDSDLCERGYADKIKNRCNPCNLHTSCFKETSYDRIYCKFIFFVLNTQTNAYYMMYRCIKIAPTWRVHLKRRIETLYHCIDTQRAMHRYVYNMYWLTNINTNRHITARINQVESRFIRMTAHWCCTSDVMCSDDFIEKYICCIGNGCTRKCYGHEAACNEDNYRNITKVTVVENRKMKTPFVFRPGR